MKTLTKPQIKTLTTSLLCSKPSPLPDHQCNRQSSAVVHVHRLYPSPLTPPTVPTHLHFPSTVHVHLHQTTRHRPSPLSPYRLYPKSHNINTHVRTSKKGPNSPAKETQPSNQQAQHKQQNETKKTQQFFSLFEILGFFLEKQTPDPNSKGLEKCFWTTWRIFEKILDLDHRR